jgi:MFS family permease
MLIGFWIAGLIAENYALADGHLWRNIWMVPAAIAFLVFLFFAIFFKDRKKSVITEVEVEKGLAKSPVT